MRETSNYKLSQWEKTDRIKMEDFNSDNQKIDSQLHAAMQQLAQAASQEGLAAEQAAREAAVSAEAAAREAADTAQAAALRNELAAEKAAREAADTQLRSENMWVKLGEATLQSAGTTLTMTIPSAELYSRFSVQFSTAGPKELYLTLNSTTKLALVWDMLGSATAQIALGYANIVLTHGGAVLSALSKFHDTSDISHTKNPSSLYSGLAFSGTLTLGLESQGNMAQGTHFAVYGLKK